MQVVFQRSADVFFFNLACPRIFFPCQEVEQYQLLFRLLWGLLISCFSWRLARRICEDYIKPWEHCTLLELHGQEMSNSLSNSMDFRNISTYEWFIWLQWHRYHFGLFTKNCNLNVAILCAHLLPTYEESDYPNYLMVKVPSNLCHLIKGCASYLQHTQLFEVKRLLVICTATTRGGNLFQNTR